MATVPGPMKAASGSPATPSSRYAPSPRPTARSRNRGSAKAGSALGTSVLANTIQWRCMTESRRRARPGAARPRRAPSKAGTRARASLTQRPPGELEEHVLQRGGAELGPVQPALGQPPAQRALVRVEQVGPVAVLLEQGPRAPAQLPPGLALLLRGG